jgi:hypothetical protein
MSKIIRRFMAVLVLTAWAGSTSAALLPPVSVNGKEWLQPLDFTSYSWNTISTVCNTTTGACNGSLGGNDMTGWTWADVDAVNGLFNTYISDAGGNAYYGYPLSGPSGAFELNSTWAPAILSDFQATGVTGNQLMGWLSTEIYPTAAYVGTVTDFNAPSSDSASTDGFSAKVNAGFGVGAWFVRDAPSGVPVPGTLFLLGLGLLGLRVSRQRTI